MEFFFQSVNLINFSIVRLNFAKILIPYLLTYNLASLSGPNSARARYPKNEKKARPGGQGNPEGKAAAAASQ